MPSPLRRRLAVFLVLVLLVSGAVLARWLLVGRYQEVTDNAYVQGEITRLSSQLSARVVEVLVEDNQHVEQGQLLVRLEQDDFELALKRAQAALATREAELAQAHNRLTQQQSLIAASAADVNATQATLSRAQLDLGRAQALRKPGFVSEERVTTLSTDSHVASSRVSKAQADLRAQKLQLGTLEGDIKRLTALLEGARADLAQAKLNLSRTEIRAPATGTIGQRAARVGQFAQPATHLLSLVPDAGLWVQANFKETQVGRIQPGQSAELEFDSYSGQPIKGRVDSLFPASGAQFSLLPPDNATGNFTKVVQRIPVKLLPDQDNPLAGQIRPGMSVTVTVHLNKGE